MPLNTYVFDAYGTLFDVHSAVRKHADSIGEEGPQLSEIWRTKQLEYSWVRALMGSYTDFWKLTEEALDYALAATPGVGAHWREKLLEAYWTLDCYPEVPGVLARLREEGASTAILSNGSTEMLGAAVTSAGLDGLFDAVLSVDAVKTFKTAPQVYQMVTDTFEVERPAISFQSSNRWDIAGAARYGFNAVWINRVGQPDEYPAYTPDRVIGSLADL
ncbi:haloacid dehalogenase type II [Oricola cellulosilytica]|uniref:(S)-2-haloacid dehalogenase n=1 Tax=Oricola cellulosilytica TaxID=1429082 RepID=A0A4R0PF11_9HYPH|nr:haloacid dehalogenase type II [Oricola cellulosilytica]TCD14074.1 haloacid dehalogenase type II [Oricola cellulosilytica]